ncbi:MULTISPECIES: calcium/sodium antiporter [Mycobacteriaceae]|uniref:calcium/sodium antiporter n=1 Tax=Mycobacteriaceae TaxID=1762 RepID=UPI0007FF88F2|nr:MULTISPECIES: calcium/sodium antiporter [Mycobacteriaceae]MCK0173744.1 calcium/sodium antiporter [Mycolicibacterium sp. F2034L]OBB57191.1 sodium:calcium antiporter [Mycobacterium sp. 852013-51886_SCH5428379]
MLADILWFAVGLGTLVVGAEVMVRGGTRLAGRLGISPIIVGLTVVSIGTSMPELAVGVVAAADGSGALAVGNIAGTNVVNLLLILGLSAWMVPLALQARTIRLELPLMAAAAVLLWVLAADGVMSRVDGVILLVVALGYTVAVIWSARHESGAVAEEFADMFPEEHAAVSTVVARRQALRESTMLLGGIVLVVIGADWLVDGAVGMARQFGVSDALIGLTVVAIGTSAPELVTTVMSTLRGDRDIAIGNLVGSSIYNIALILGVTCLVPAGGLVLPSSLVNIDIPIMVIVALACIPIFMTGRRVSRGEGGAMVFAYLAYLVFLLSTQT